MGRGRTKQVAYREAVKTAHKGTTHVRRKDVSGKRVVVLKPASHQPSKADTSIDATAEELAKAVMRDVTIRTQEP